MMWLSVTDRRGQGEDCSAIGINYASMRGEECERLAQRLVPAIIENYHAAPGAKPAVTGLDLANHHGRAHHGSAPPVNHAGLRFDAGQFIWLSFEPSALTLQQHPFSLYSSAAHAELVEVTIKELGDFTSTIGSVQPGRAVFLEGPYGAFTMPVQAKRAVMIAGGVGITPIMSMLRTQLDRQEDRPLSLLYATASPDRTIFLDELRVLEERLPLELTHVFERPPAEWTGSAD